MEFKHYFLFDNVIICELIKFKYDFDMILIRNNYLVQLSLLLYKLQDIKVFFVS